jgi:hypothetical protein
MGSLGCETDEKTWCGMVFAEEPSMKHCGLVACRRASGACMDRRPGHGKFSVELPVTFSRSLRHQWST